MSDEEKQAIEYLKRHIIPYYGRKGTIEFMLNDTLLNLIEKQSKEIEELKITKKELTERVLRLESDKFWDNVVSKDKIKAKIEELEKGNKNTFIRGEKILVLQSLLKKDFPTTITKEELEKRWKE